MKYSHISFVTASINEQMVGITVTVEHISSLELVEKLLLTGNKRIDESIKSEMEKWWKSIHSGSNILAWNFEYKS